jgi:hypothetical protein
VALGLGLVLLGSCAPKDTGDEFLNTFQRQACAKFDSCGMDEVECDAWLESTGFGLDDACLDAGEYHAEYADLCLYIVDHLTCEDAESYVDRGWAVPYCDMALAGCLPDSGE